GLVICRRHHATGDGPALSRQPGGTGQEGSRGGQGREGLPSKIHNVSSNEVERGSSGETKRKARRGGKPAPYPPHMPVISNDKPPRLVGGSRSQVDVGGCGWVREAIEPCNQRQEPHCGDFPSHRGPPSVISFPLPYQKQTARSHARGLFGQWGLDSCQGSPKPYALRSRQLLNSGFTCSWLGTGKFTS